VFDGDDASDGDDTVGRETCDQVRGLKIGRKTLARSFTPRPRTSHKRHAAPTNILRNVSAAIRNMHVDRSYRSSSPGVPS